jgi:hypothetical protein
LQSVGGDLVGCLADEARGDAEVNELHTTGVVDEDVPRLDVAVAHPPGVEMAEDRRQLERDRQPRLQRQPAVALHMGGEVLAADVDEHEAQLIAVFAQFLRRDYARDIQAAEDRKLAAEPGDHAVIAPIGVDALEHHAAVVAAIHGAEQAVRHADVELVRDRVRVVSHAENLAHGT